MSINTILHKHTGPRQRLRIPAIALAIFALLTAACSTQPAQPAPAQVQATATPQAGVGGGGDVALPAVGGVDVVATSMSAQGDVVRAITAQVVISQLTQSVQATGQAVAYQQTQMSISAGSTAQALQAVVAQQAVTATAGANSIIATQGAIVAQATSQAVIAISEREAQQAVIDLQAQQTQAQQAQDRRVLLNSITTLGLAALAVVGVVFVVAIGSNIITAQRRRNNVQVVEGEVIQYGNQWQAIPQARTRALPRPNPDLVIEPIIDAQPTIRVNSGGVSYEVERISEEENRARELALKLIASAIRYHGENGGDNCVIPGYRALASAGLRPRTSSAWRQAIAPLQAQGLIVSRPGVGTILTGEGDCSSLTRLYRSVRTGTIALHPVDSDVIENDTNW